MRGEHRPGLPGLRTETLSRRCGCYSSAMGHRGESERRASGSEDDAFRIGVVQGLYGYLGLVGDGSTGGACQRSAIILFAWEAAHCISC